jgi:glycosyltransferase involved in cell wall biosynthesis
MLVDPPVAPIDLGAEAARIAAKVDAVDKRYFESEIEALLDLPGIEFVGEVSEAGKPAFLGNATALLFPIDWPEPFGLAMIEAMSCGTPVIAWPHGAAPEIVEDGVTGYLVDSIDAAVLALEKAARLDRQRVRERFEARFSAARMARDYLSLYRALGRRRALAAV